MPSDAFEDPKIQWDFARVPPNRGRKGQGIDSDSTSHGPEDHHGRSRKGKSSKSRLGKKTHLATAFRGLVTALLEFGDEL